MIEDYNDDYQEIMDNILSINNVKLVKVSHIDALKDKAKGLVKFFYDKGTSDAEKAGTLLNAIMTQQTCIFLMSFRTFNDLLTTDPNIDTKSIRGGTYRTLMHGFLADGKNGPFLDRIREPVKGRAGLYEMINKKTLSILGEQMGLNAMRVKRTKYIEWYDNNPLKIDIDNTYANSLTEFDRAIMKGIKKNGNN